MPCWCQILCTGMKKLCLFGLICKLCEQSLNTGCFFVFSPDAENERAALHRQRSLPHRPVIPLVARMADQNTSGTPAMTEREASRLDKFKQLLAGPNTDLGMEQFIHHCHYCLFIFFVPVLFGLVLHLSSPCTLSRLTLWGSPAAHALTMLWGGKSCCHLDMQITRKKQKKTLTTKAKWQAFVLSKRQAFIQPQRVLLCQRPWNTVRPLTQPSTLCTFKVRLLIFLLLFLKMTCIKVSQKVHSELQETFHVNKKLQKL